MSLTFNTSICSVQCTSVICAFSCRKVFMDMGTMCRSYQVTSISICLDIYHLFVWQTFKLFQLSIQYLVKYYKLQRAALGEYDPHSTLCPHYYKLLFPLSVLFLLLMMISKLGDLIHC